MYVTLGILSCSFLSFLSCQSTPQNRPLSFPEKAPKTLQIYLSADVEGSLEPCGCKSGQIGGLPRQAQFFLISKKSPSLLLDAGNTMLPAVNRYEYFKWYYILQIYERMGYDALNLGPYEVALSASQISQMAVKLNIPFVSSNTLSVDHKPLVKPYIIKEVEGIKIGILGLVETKEALGEGIILEKPEAAVARYLPELLTQSHLIVVLSALSLENLNALAQKFPQIGMILNTGAGSFLPQKINSVVVSSLTAKSRYVQQIQFGFDSLGALDWVNGMHVPLDEKISNHQGTVYLLDRYRNDLATQHFYLENLEASIDKFVGAAACAPCHEEMYAIWKNTRHAHALTSLKEKNSHNDPHCLKCHVTGFGIKGGYSGEEQTPDFAFIGCEVCHGPSMLHTRPEKTDQLRPSTSNPSPKKICLECHTWEHCENFDFDSFWAKIAHSKTKTR